MRLLLLVFSFFLLGSPFLVHAEGDPAAGQAKAGTCLACHGPDGNSVNPQWPKLAGQHPGYTKKQLVEFQASEMRRNVMMAPMIAGLNEQDMDDLAAFYARARSGSNSGNGYTGAETWRPEWQRASAAMDPEAWESRWPDFLRWPGSTPRTSCSNSKPSVPVSGAMTSTA